MADRMDWFPFHAQDFLTSRTVLLMSDENVGRYVKLLAESWVHGPLPKDMGKMGRLIRLSAAEMAEAWEEIGPAFVETAQGFVNRRLEATRQEQIAKRERYANAGRKGAEARWQSDGNGDANGDANGNANATANGSKKEKVEVETDTEEKKGPSAPKKSRACQLPDGWTPNDHHRQLSRSLGVGLEAEVAQFRDHHLARGSTFKDWDRAFNTWLRNAKKFNRGAVSPGSTAAAVRTEQPKASGPRQTTGLEPVGGEAPSRNDEADRWLKEHPDEADELLREAQDDMGWALENTRNPEVKRNMVLTAVRRKALERIDAKEAA